MLQQQFIPTNNSAIFTEHIDTRHLVICMLISLAMPTPNGSLEDCIYKT
jgi:hypothetical protein